MRPNDLPPGLYAGLKETLGHTPRVEDLQTINFAAIQEVMQRGTELRLAQWVHTVMMVLRDHFEFKEEDLAKFSRLFRAGVEELAKVEAAQDAEGEHDQEENPKD